MTGMNDLRCQIVAGKQCKMIFKFDMMDHTHAFNVTFWIKLDHTVQVMNIEELTEIEA